MSRPRPARTALCALAIFLFIPAGAAVIQVGAVTTDAGSATSYSHSHTVSGTDRLLVVEVALGDDAPTVTGVTYGGQALTQLQRASTNRGGGGNDVSVEVWYLLDPPTGTSTVTVTTSAATSTSIGAISLTGIDQATPIDGTTASTGDPTGNPSLTVTSEPGDLVLDAVGSRTFTAPSVGAGQTQRWRRELNDNQNDGWGAGSSEAGAASVTMSWTTDNAGYAQVAFNTNRALPTGTFLAPNDSQEFMLGDTMTVRFQEDTYTADVTNVTFLFDGVQHQPTEVSTDLWEANITIPNSTAKGTQTITAQMRDGAGTVLNTTTRDVVVTPRLSAVTVDDPVQGGTTQTVTPAGVVDSAGDPLQFFCSESTTAPTLATTVCTEGATSYTSPYGSMTCTYTAPLPDGSNTVNCRVYDGTWYSAARSATYDTDATGPSVAAPTFTDYTDRHAFNVSAVVTDPHVTNGSCTVHAGDGEGNNVTATGTFDDSYGAADEALCTYSNLNSSITGFDVLEPVSVKVVAADALGNTANSTAASHPVPNQPPGTPGGVTLQVPALDFVVDDHPNVTWTNGGDPESDPYNTSLHVAESSGPRLLEALVAFPGTEQQIGNTVALIAGADYDLSLQACDAWNCSAYTANISFHRNEHPHINAVSLANRTVPPDTETYLEANVTDHEDTVRWVNFTVWNETGNELLFSNANGTRTGDLWRSQNFTTASADNVTYNWSITAFDGYERSLTVTGAFVTANTLPRVVSGPTFTDYTDRHAFNVSAVVNDSTDDDIANYTITLDDLDGNVHTYTRDVDRTYGDAQEAAANFSSVNDSLAGFAVGEDIHIEITFRDQRGAEVTTGIADHPIPNQDPAVTDVSVSPASPRTNDSLTAAVTHTDAEGDPLLTTTYTWLRNGGGTGLTDQAVDDGFTTEGENWSVAVTVQDVYGGLSAVRRDSVIVQNTPTTLAANISAENASNSHAVTFSARVDDADGISDLSCRFGYGNGSNWFTRPGVLASDGGFNDTAVCRGTVTAGDHAWAVPYAAVEATLKIGDENATLLLGNLSAPIPNRAPGITLSFPANGASTTPGSQTFSWSGDDAEDDVLNHTFRLYRGTALVTASTTNATSTSRSLAAGTYRWNVMATDTYQGVNLSTAQSANRTLTVAAAPAPDGNGGGGGGGTGGPSVRPSTTDEFDQDFDPGRVVRFNVTVTDAAGIERVWAEYRSSPWQNATVLDRGDGVYTVAFLPGTEGTYTVRVHAINARGTETVYERNLTVAYERQWTREPAFFDERVARLPTTTIRSGNLTVRNLGEASIPFDVEVNADAPLRLGLPTRFTLDAGANRTFPVVASLPNASPEFRGAYRFTIALVPGSETEPGELLTSGTAIFTGEGPFVFPDTDRIPRTVTAGGTLELPVTVENVGTEAAPAAWASIAVPEGWTVAEPRNVSLGRMVPGAVRNVSFTVTAPGEPGEYALRFLGGSGTGAPVTIDRTITVRPGTALDPLLPLLILVVMLAVFLLLYHHAYGGLPLGGFPQFGRQDERTA